jgi:hypothetical protein
MGGEWLQDIEALETISQDEQTRALFLRMAALQRSGGMSSFLIELDRDPEVDDDVKGPLAEIARDTDFLLAVEEYCLKTDRLH